MIYKIAAAVAVITLTGCAHQLELYSRNGLPKGSGTAQELGKQVTFNVKGSTYKGIYTHDGGKSVLNITNASATAYSGNKSARVYGSSNSTTYIPGSGQGRVFAHSDNNDSIRCEFEYRSGSGIGVCQDNDDNLFDLIIR